MFACLRGLLAVAIVAASSTAAQAGPYSALYVFGDSLSDGGNNSIVFDSNFGGARTPTPIPTSTFIPTFTYASGRYSNGPVWVEQLAAAWGLALTPSLAGGGNWAFGGATTGPASANLLNPFPASLSTQVQTYLGSTGGVADASALYVVAGGGNDARAVLNGLVSPGVALASYISNELAMIGQLYGAGARNILVVGTPDVGKTPALLGAGPGAAAAASGLSDAMNGALELALASLPQAVQDAIIYFDIDALVDEAVADPASFGLTDVTSACAFSAACIASPSTTLFWDGIHPTAAGHALVAAAALGLLPEPATWALVALLLLGVVGGRVGAGGVRRAAVRA